MGRKIMPKGSRAGRRDVVLSLLGAALALPTLTATTRAQTGWPNRQVTLVVPYPAGGYIDVVTRIVADGLRERSGQTIVVLNKSGGNGQLALGDLSRAAPDGYTLLTNNDGGIGLPPALDRNFRFEPVKDYLPIAQVVQADYILTTRGGLPVRSVADLIAHAKKAPTPLTFASPGLGSTPHIGMEYFIRQAGIEAIHVPYTGAAPAINDLVAGHVDVYMASLPTMIGHLGTDRVRVLATLSKTRARETPEVPTMEEAGLPGFVLTGWLGLFGPPGMGDDLRATISRTIAEVVQDPKVTERLRATSAAPITKESAEFGPFYLAEVARWKKFSQDTNIKVGD
jgi:tripartite-type tricarboxylate transporter receptor subunit TctC